ncbi:MAG: hypothetical protein ISR65_14950 [Bacteriovoracaceae bacterium]|nr:hypothetical protein [Bacteriovoracaceae bacterium]
MLKKVFLVVLICVASAICQAQTQTINKKDRVFYKLVFKNIHSAKTLKIADPFLTDAKNNNLLLKVYDKNKKHLGFIRNLNTTTGCNSLCLPLIFTLFFDSNAKFIKLLSTGTLTKLGHEKFTEQDLAKLNFLLQVPPQSFLKIKQPIEVVDAITMATKKEFIKDVVPQAGLTSFRTFQYLQQTQKKIKSDFLNGTPNH